MLMKTFINLRNSLLICLLPMLGNVHTFPLSPNSCDNP